MYTPSEILVLARAYGDATKLSLTTVGRKAVGNNAFLTNLDRGRGCHSKTLCEFSAWINENWPAEVPWPPQVERRDTDRTA